MYRCVSVGLLLSGLLLMPESLPAQPASSAPLAALLKASRWQQRVLLLYAPTPADAALRRQQELLRAARPGLAARDVLVRVLVGSELAPADARYLTQRLSVDAGRFSVVLLGKDGGVKRRETQPVAPASLFSTIDAMPMRQQETRQRPQ
jgi:Domain of unknown function (DUF4174)